MTNKLHMALLIATAILFSGCAQKSLYRENYQQECNYLKLGDCSSSAIQRHISDNGKNDYYLSFLEFDDQGQLLDRYQMHNVIDKYASIAGTEDVLLIVFIHGWHHNAAPDDSNVMEFDKLLSKLSKIEYNSHSKRKVLGVYVGWRGESITVPPLNYTTFWDRKNTAHEIGQQGVTEALLKLEEIVNVKAGLSTPNNNRLVTIGHSFGGAILYTSLQQILIDRFVNSHKGQTYSKLESNGFGDLVVLMNPAFEALRYGTLYDLSQDYCRVYPSSQLPKLAILTSETDRATDWAFPAGRFFSTLFDTHATLNRNDCSDKSKRINPIEIDEYDADLTTVGHFSPYITHNLQPAGNPVKREANFNYAELKQVWSKQSPSGKLIFENTELVHLGKTETYNPFLNIKVDSSLISGHNDIWHDDVVNFLRDLITISTTQP